MWLVVLNFLLILSSGVWFIRCDSGSSDGIKIQIVYNETSRVTYCESLSQNYFTESQYIYIEYDGLKNEVSGVTAERCYKKNNDTHTFATPKKKQYNWTSKDVIVEVDMRTIWTCRFKRNLKGSFSCDFPVHVLFKNTPKVSINNEDLKPQTAKYPVIEYDAESQYEYYDDELVQITCHLTEGSGLKFRVNNFNNDSLILPTDYVYDIKSINLRAVLNKNYNLPHVDCVVRRTETVDSIHRIFMKPKRNATDKNDILIRVNGLILAPISDKKTINYNYVVGDLFNVTCESLNNSSNELTLSSPNDKIERNVTKVDPNVLTTSVDTYNYDEKDEPLLTCQISKHSEKKLYLKQEPKGGVIIHGMTQRNIIFEYSNEIYATIYIYEYKDDEDIDFTWEVGDSRAYGCYNITAHILLTWKDMLLDNSECALSTTSSRVIASLKTRLSPEDDGTIIKCLIRYTWNRREFWIVLRRKSDTEEGNVPSNNALHTRRIIIMVAVSCVLSIIILVLLLCIIYKHYYRRRQTLLKETGEANENDGVIPRSSQFPKQWDEYANTMVKGTQPSTSYMDPKYMYATPMPKKLRQVKDQAVVRENSLYEPLHDGPNKNKDGQMDRYVNLHDDSYINFETPNHETDTYCEVSLRG